MLKINNYANDIASLFECEFPKTFSLMKVRVLRVDHVPAQEMRLGQTVSAFVKITPGLDFSKGFDLVVDKCLFGNDQ